MPVVCVRLKNGLVVVEKNSKNCYHDVIAQITQIRRMVPLTDNVDKEDPLTKNDCQDLLNSVTATSELQRIKHVIASMHNLSQRQARRIGLRHLRQRATQVENATETVKNIRSKHNYFAKLEQKAFLHSQGLDFGQYFSSSSEWDSEDEDVVATEESPCSHTLVASLDIEETLANSDTEKGAINCQDHVGPREIHSISSTAEYTSQQKQGDSLQKNTSTLFR